MICGYIKWMMQWTWMAGSDTVNPPAKKDNSSNDVEPNLSNAIGWYDGSKYEFWLFSGDAYLTRA